MGSSLVESNGLVCPRVSEESHNLGPRSLHWPVCLSGPPQTACGAGRRLNRYKGSSCCAFSSFCGGPLPLGVSEIAAGSERDTHLKREPERSAGSDTPLAHFGMNRLSEVPDEPVLLPEDVLLLLLAATPLALVIQWCSSAGKLSDPAGSLDAPRGSLRRGETAQHTLFCINPTDAPGPASDVKRKDRMALCGSISSIVLCDLMSSCTPTERALLL